jgi:type III secretion protein J
MRNLVLAAAAVALVAGCSSPQTIVHDLDEYEANEILVVLEAKGITGSKEAKEGRVVAYNVVVDGVDAKDAMRILVANHLPRERSQTFDKVYPPGGGGLIPTKSEEKAKFMMALQGEIEHKLKTYPGIVAAHVTIVQPEKDIVRNLDTPPPPSTASVAIVYNPTDDRHTAPISSDDVKRLVSSSVEDLRMEHVEVVMKENKPTQLVSVFADSGGVEEGVAAATGYGFRFADKASYHRLNTIAMILISVAIIGLAVGAGGIVRSQGLKRRAQKAEAELTSMRKASRSTQTGLSQQQAG